MRKTTGRGKTDSHPVTVLASTQKQPAFSVKTLPQKKSQPIDSRIRSRIYGHGKGWVFTPKHFQDLGSSAAIDSSLRRLKAADTIRHLSRGLYDYPGNDPILGTVECMKRLKK